MDPQVDEADDHGETGGRDRRDGQPVARAHPGIRGPIGGGERNQAPDVVEEVSAAAVVDAGLLAWQHDQLDQERGANVEDHHERDHEEQHADVRQRREHVTVQVDETAEGGEHHRDERSIAHREVERRLVCFKLEHVDDEVGRESRQPDADRVEVHLLVERVEGRWKAHQEVQRPHRGGDRERPPREPPHGEGVLVGEGDRPPLMQLVERLIHYAVLSAHGGPQVDRDPIDVQSRRTRCRGQARCPRQWRAVGHQEGMGGLHVSVDRVVSSGTLAGRRSAARPRPDPTSRSTLHQPWC